MAGKGFLPNGPNSPDPEGDGSTSGSRGRSYGGSSVPQQGSGIGQGSSSTALDLWNSSVPAAMQVKTQKTLDRYLAKYHAGELSGSSRNKRIERAIDAIYGEGDIPRDLTTWEDIVAHSQRQTTTEQAYEQGQEQYIESGQQQAEVPQKEAATNKALEALKAATTERKAATEKNLSKQDTIGALQERARQTEEAIKYSSSSGAGISELAPEMQWSEGVFSFDDPKLKTGLLDKDGNPISLVSPELRSKLEKSYGGLGEMGMGFEDVFDDVMQRIGGKDPDRQALDPNGLVEFARILKKLRNRLTKQQAVATEPKTIQTDLERAKLRGEANAAQAEAERLQEPSPDEKEEEIWSGMEYEAANNFYYTLEEELGYPPSDLQETLARMGVSNLVKDPVSERNWYKEVRTKLDEVIKRDLAGDTNPNIPSLRKTRDAIDKYINSMTGNVNQRLANANATVPGKSTGRRTTYTEGGTRVAPVGSAEPMTAKPNVEPQTDTSLEGTGAVEPSRSAQTTGEPRNDLTTVEVQVLGDVTRPTHKSEVELDEGTHKDFVMVRQATNGGEYKYTPINGTVVRGKGNNVYFEHVDPQTGEKIGWYRIDATAERTLPVRMQQEEFYSTLSAEYSPDPEGYRALISS